jgi:hypothetical protein
MAAVAPDGAPACKIPLRSTVSRGRCAPRSHRLVPGSPGLRPGGSIHSGTLRRASRHPPAEPGAKALLRTASAPPPGAGSATCAGCSFQPFSGLLPRGEFVCRSVGGRLKCEHSCGRLVRMIVFGGCRMLAFSWVAAFLFHRSIRNVDPGIERGHRVEA